MQPKDDKHLVFVYGSLRRGSAGAITVRFPSARFVADGAVHGRLYDLGDYPGLLLDESDTTVVGELFEVDYETLNQLDKFELSSAYLRKKVDIHVGSERKQSWIYVPDFDVEYYSGHTLITSGDWVEYARKAQG